MAFLGRIQVKSGGRLELETDTKLVVADNTGARLVQCIHVLGQNVIITIGLILVMVMSAQGVVAAIEFDRQHGAPVRDRRAI